MNEVQNQYKTDQFDNNWNNKQHNMYNANSNIMQAEKNKIKNYNESINMKNSIPEMYNSNQFKRCSNNQTNNLINSNNSLIRTSSSFHNKPGHSCIACDLKQK